MTTSTIFRCPGCARHWMRHSAGAAQVKDRCPDCGEVGVPEKAAAVGLCLPDYTDDVAAFAHTIVHPLLVRDHAVPLESDKSFRSRILAVCKSHDRSQIELASAHQLDAIGRLHALTRRGFIDAPARKTARRPNTGAKL